MNDYRQKEWKIGAMANVKSPVKSKQNDEGSNN